MTPRTLPAASHLLKAAGRRNTVFPPDGPASEHHPSRTDVRDRPLLRGARDRSARLLRRRSVRIATQPGPVETEQLPVLLEGAVAEEPDHDMPRPGELDPADPEPEELGNRRAPGGRLCAGSVVGRVVPAEPGRPEPVDAVNRLTRAAERDLEPAELGIVDLAPDLD